MNTNATWITDNCQEIRVKADSPEHGWTVIRVDKNVVGLVPESQLERDEESVHPDEWNGDHARFEMRGRE
jgi:hypothetical protein